MSGGKYGDRSLAIQQDLDLGQSKGVSFVIAIQRAVYLSIVQGAGFKGGTSMDDIAKLAEISAKKLG